jgi:hypothetical protein
MFIKRLIPNQDNKVKIIRQCRILTINKEL